MSIKDGASYAPEGKAKPVVEKNEFRFSVAFLDHGHIYGQTNGLIEAGGTLVSVYDPKPERVDAFINKYPHATAASGFDEILADDSIHLVASAAVPDKRADIGQQVMKAGKDYFTDKSPFTQLDQLSSTRQVVAETSRRYFVYYAERLHNEAAWHAGELVQSGAVGDVIQVLNLAPHRLAPSSRPDWFFDKSRYGGILTDIGSHQVEQFLTYADCSDARVIHASVRNHPDYPGLEDFGEMSLKGDNGASFYSRVDWYTPEGMPVWGDGRTFILGTEGSMEIRKYVDPGRSAPASLILLANGDTVKEIDCLDQTGLPFFGELILDVLNGTENSMTQEHIFKAAELSMEAQLFADEQSTW